MKRNKRQQSRNLRGGAFTQDEEEQLRHIHFQDDEINHLNELGIPFDTVNQAISYYHDNSFQLIMEIAERFHNANSGINEQQEMEGPSQMGEEQQPFLNMHDLDVNDEEEGPNATEGVNEEQYMDETDAYGGMKRRHTTQRKRALKNKKGNKKSYKKMKGGTCYGRGYGANSFDPNLSIYNTRMPSLFPYRPK
jgi:hypothetical protein